MAGGSAGRSLEQTPTWAVAVVCFVLVSVSIIIEFIIHRIAKWLTKKRKRALYEALEKMKSELVLLGFISLLLTVGQSPISSICISKKAGATWHPCNKKEEAKLNRSENTDYENRRRLLSISGSAGESFRRVLAAGASTDKCAAMGKVPFVSSDGIHQLHIFIFVLAIFHILYCILTLALGRAKMKKLETMGKGNKNS
ncbi:MLO-LIKE PROTEIN 1 [Salix purpurea]|uniref:MLO-LIKE PROTEIN 1 n=1 Tax=Salix purpurea TaxID=77065 RepID=A0A9Q0PNP1_SALPP|nr:MLO-LIKE PROTEIN 1 [Salix purpurea]KAJ6691586.1 MLO-LIKE PROTEIN 1 [Salix purpurea]